MAPSDHVVEFHIECAAATQHKAICGRRIQEQLHLSMGQPTSKRETAKKESLPHNSVNGRNQLAQLAGSHMNALARSIQSGPLPALIIAAEHPTRCAMFWPLLTCSNAALSNSRCAVARKSRTRLVLVSFIFKQNKVPTTTKPGRHEVSAWLVVPMCWALRLSRL